MKAYLDTPIIVAASVPAHPHHHESLATLALVREKTISAAISAHGLSESYAVLTSTPFVPRVYPAEAWNLLSRNILPYLEVVTLTPEIYRDTIQTCALAGWIGGRIYDALHLRCAQQAHCDRIYTFNVRHFRQLAPELSDRIGPPSGFP